MSTYTGGGSIDARSHGQRLDRTEPTCGTSEGVEMNRYLRHAMATLAVIAAAALIPSAAVARTDPPSSPANSQASPATKQAESTVVSYGYPVTSTSTSDDGFQWGDAALGAGIVAALGLA